MNKSFEVQTRNVSGNTAHLYISREKSSNPKRLLCIHGAGVAGRLTFDYIIQYLNSYDEVLVPDLPGMGESCDALQSLPTIEDYIQAVEEALSDFNWKQFDICGYSLGGLIAAKLIENNLETHQFIINQKTLIEPALFDDPDINTTRKFRKHYKEIANELLNGGDTQQGVLSFLNLVSPNRTKNPRADKIAIARLGQRPLGFAQALHAVATESETIERNHLIQSIQPVTILAGQNSYPKMLNYHQELSQNSSGWHFIIIPGCDHSIPYQKPRRIAEILDEQ